MKDFTIPTSLNGTQLIEELKAVGITLPELPLVSADKLWLNIKDSEVAKATKVVQDHVGVETAPTLLDKLSAMGIDLQELKAVLGV